MTEEKAENSIPTGINPWLKIWYAPEKALDFVFRYQREEFLHRLYFAHGFMLMLALRLPDWINTKFDPVGVMIQMLLVGPMLGAVIGYVQSAVLGAYASWTGEPVDKKLIRALIAWTSLPFTVALTGFTVAYAAMNKSMGPDALWFLVRPEGWIPMGIGLAVALYGGYIRTRGISLLFTLPKPKAAIWWFGSFLMTFVPLAAIIALFFTVFYATVIGH